MTRFTAALFLIGVLVLLALVLHIGPAVIAAELAQLGWKLLWVLAPSVVVYLLDALGWRATLGRHAERLPFRRLFMTRMTSTPSDTGV